ncbi:hypothetical protein [Pseudonocardia humida]|uniref:Secreted protein n=1 Tax=Pseudonocardia humida TaxID=2800819 RepID=A0ABT1A6X4_9PSEU|nr:hypothetical protein [Pseudonocardia humida]MCO1658749.1 hypothetical protein [Pseudonocardia humida]
MKRLFWLGVGLAAGSYVARRANAAAQALTPAGVGANLADGLRELGAGLGAFGAEVRAGMNEREQELSAMVERQTGARLPTYVDALQEPARSAPPAVRGRRPAPRARARRAGA